MKKIISSALFLVAVFTAMATHIVGGFISYSYVAGTTSTYNIKLKIYRDCNSQTVFDGLPDANGMVRAGHIFVYDNFGSLVTTIDLDAPTVTNIDPPIDNPCLTNTSGVCVEEGVYTITYTLPSDVQGYTIAYVRCCRNGSIDNIMTPGSQGGTYSAYIPPTATYHNSSPEFNQFPPTFICLNAPLRFDHSASDANGDVLTYSLCSPQLGGDTMDPAPLSPAGPPFQDVYWETGYSAINPLGNNSLQIDPNTGFLTGTPNAQGQFVVGICVSEYRGGVLIATYLRDFQFNVTPCNIPVADIPSTDINPGTGVGTYIINCSNLHVVFQNTSYNPPPVGVPITYNWDFGVPGITTDVSNQPVPFYDYPDTGTYFVTLIATKGTGLQACIDTTYAFVYIYPTHHSDFTTANVCEGTSANFTDQSISTVGNVNQWNWNFGDGNTSGASNPTHLYTTSGTYNVTLVGGNDLGCRDTIVKPITIYSTPVADFSFAQTCVNSPVNFTDNSTGTITAYAWQFGNGASDTQANPTTTYNTVGNFNVDLIVASAGCSDTITKSITVNPVPVVANNDTAICPGQSVQLRASGGSVYTWSPALYLNDSTLANPVSTPVPPSSITYNVTAVNAFQCSASDAVTILFFAPPNVFAGIDTSVCLSGANFKDSVQLNAIGAFSYQWMPSFSLNSAFIQNPIARPLTNTTYLVMGTDANGCAAFDSVTVYVLDPNINVIIDATKNVCIGDTVYANVTSQGASNYVWTPNQFLVNPNSYSPGFYPAINTTYTLTVSNYCYTKSDDILIVVLPLPTLSFTQKDSVCVGDTLQIFANGAQVYQWNFDNTLSALNISNPFAWPDTSQFYYVTATDINGCTNYDSTFINVVQLPIVNAGNDTLIWKDTKAFLDGSTDASKYFWSPKTFLHSYQSLQTSADITKTQAYVLYVENDFGCVNSDSIIITVETNNLLLVPTAFSPNGDGVNDVFRILRYLNIGKLKEFSVWNRWGEKVFSTNDIEEGWNGKFRNIEQEMGVYVWQIIAETKDPEEITRRGNVTLVR